MKDEKQTHLLLVHSIAAVVLLLTAQISLAGSATWLSSPQDAAWENVWMRGLLNEQYVVGASKHVHFP